jgi:nitrate/nitrite-specific signal transduction histidine kinase
VSVAGSGSDLSEFEPAGHFGLIGIAERARRLGGGAELVGSEGRGTTVIVTVPDGEDKAEMRSPKAVAERL